MNATSHLFRSFRSTTAVGSKNRIFSSCSNCTPIRSRIAAGIYPMRMPTPEQRHYATASSNPTEQTKADHSRFLAEAPHKAKWTDKSTDKRIKVYEDFDDSVEDGQGKLSPTSSHLFKLILPLAPFFPKKNTPPTVILLHPSQPLSHVARLVASSLPTLASSGSNTSANTTYDINFRSARTSSSQQVQWSDSTDVGDFIRDAAHATRFHIHISPNPAVQHNKGATSETDKDEYVLPIIVPSYASRTRFIRRRLELVQNRLSSMEELKKTCDREAHRGARRMALSGFGALVIYWGAVARLTFWDFGWDIMEPITYLSGLSTVICGYLWFLYQGREVSYSSVLDQSISTRRQALYRNRGFDVDAWADLVAEAKSLRRELAKIAEDYGERAAGEPDEDEMKELRDEATVGKANKELQEAKEIEEKGNVQSVELKTSSGWTTGSEGAR